LARLLRSARFGARVAGGGVRVCRGDLVEPDAPGPTIDADASGAARDVDADAAGAALGSAHASRAVPPDDGPAMKRAQMIYRLIDIKRRAADAAETAHVAAHHATVAAQKTLQHAVADWEELTEENSGVRSIADIEDRDCQSKWLRKIIGDAEQDLLVARNDEAMKREVMTEARIELRRYETWLENTKELQRIEAERRKQA
jgi:hypothetical protein